VEAALILHVADVSSPHAQHQIAHVLKVLAEIGAGDTPQLLALNKMDLAPGAEAEVETAISRLLAGSHPRVQPRAAAVSARTGQGIGELLAAVDEVLPADPLALVRFRFPAGEGDKIGMVHEFGRVRATEYHGDHCEIEAEAPLSLRERLGRYIV